MAIKIKDSEQCTLSFEHVRTHEPSKLVISRNPLTGNWLQEHTIGSKSTAYYSDENDAVRLVNNIVNKSRKANLPCSVTIEPRKVMPD